MSPPRPRGGGKPALLSQRSLGGDRPARVCRARPGGVGMLPGQRCLAPGPWARLAPTHQAAPGPSSSRPLAPPGPPAASRAPPHPASSLLRLLPSNVACSSRPLGALQASPHVPFKPPPAPSPWSPPVPSTPPRAPRQGGVLSSSFWHSLQGPLRPRHAGEPCVWPDGGGARWTHTTCSRPVTAGSRDVVVGAPAGLRGCGRHRGSIAGWPVGTEGQASDISQPAVPRSLQQCAVF